MKELHLFIIWDHAQHQKQAIIDDIKETFEVLKILDIQWDKPMFSKNLTRFYGENLPANSHKEIECGTGPFTLIIVSDNVPKYLDRVTSKGVFKVNANMFDAKQKYRKWTGGGHKIHSTNDQVEFQHDVFLLLGIIPSMYEQYLSLGEMNARLDINLAGCNQWKSLEQVFSIMNSFSNYCVLRNFSNIGSDYCYRENGDIDILVEGEKKLIDLLDLKPLTNRQNGSQYLLKVAGHSIILDFITDKQGLFDSSWIQNVLKNKILQGGVYRPSEEDYYYLLIYHLLLLKPNVPAKYLSEFDGSFDEKSLGSSLHTFLKKNGYQYSIPEKNQYFNYSVAGLKMNWKRSVRLYLRARVSNIKQKIPARVKKKIKTLIHRFFL